MAQLVIENLEDELRDKLQGLARDHGRSLEDEVRDILREVLAAHRATGPNLGSRIAACFGGHGLEQPLPELRGHLVEPPIFHS